MAEKKNGGLAFLSNPKSRMMVIGAGVVVVAGLALAVNGMIKKNSLEKEQTEAPSTAALPSEANKKTVIDPNKVDAKQSELRKAANEEAAKKADSNGQTFIATMRPDAGDANGARPDANMDTSGFAGRGSFGANAFGARMAGPREPTEQEIREAEAAHQKQVEEWKRKLLADKTKINEAWEPGSHVFYTAYVGDESKADKKTDSVDETGKPVTDKKKKKKGQVVAKAGDLYYGTIDIGMNTDEPSAVTAYILSGPFKGGKLTGTIAGQTAPYSEKAVIQFTLLNHPRFEHSQEVKIFAVDKNTRRAAVADSVDRHLFAKFGLAAAVDFAQGYAEGKAQVPATITVGQNGGPIIVTRPEATTRQLMARGAARTMARVANTLEPYISRPNTLEVYSGTEVGLLVVTDVLYIEEPDDEDVADNSKPNKAKPEQQSQQQNQQPAPQQAAANPYNGWPPPYSQPSPYGGYPSQPAYGPAYGQRPYGQMPAYGPTYGPVYGPMYGPTYGR